jgi:hypothetical protein
MNDGCFDPNHSRRLVLRGFPLRCSPSVRWNIGHEIALSDEDMKKLRPLDPRNLALAVDLELEGAWRVEYFDSAGAGYITIFVGQSAELRARDYYDAIERGVLNSRIPDARS